MIRIRLHYVPNIELSSGLMDTIFKTESWHMKVARSMGKKKVPGDLGKRVMSWFPHIVVIEIVF